MVDGHHVLLVDDEFVVRSMVAEFLRLGGYRVTACAGPEEALAAQACGRLSDVVLLVTDVSMPGMDGPTLAARLRTTLPTVRTLYMSGGTDAAVDGGAFIEKPFSVDRFLAAVGTALGTGDRTATG